MSKKIARYSVSYGLSGCYMPDSVSFGMEFTRRRDLAQFIRDELEFYDMPACLFREVNVRRLWQAIMRHGSSSYGFYLDHKENVLHFHGLTEDEFNESQEEF